MAYSVLQLLQYYAVYYLDSTLPCVCDCVWVILHQAICYRSNSFLSIDAW